MPIRMVMTTEPVMVDGSVHKFHRAEIWGGDEHPHVMDVTGLFDNPEEARGAGEGLLELYDTPQHNDLILLGYVTVHDSLENGANPMSVACFKEPVGNYVVPVYIKVNDAFVTRSVSGDSLTDIVKRKD